jgi:hypothetical protein
MANRRRTDNTMAKRQKNRQHNGQKKKDKRTNNDLQNIHISKDRVTRTPPKKKNRQHNDQQKKDTLKHNS